MPTVTAFNAPGVFEPPTYTQAIKVHQAQTLLFLSGFLASRFPGQVPEAVAERVIRAG